MKASSGAKPGLVHMLVSLINEREREKAHVARILHDEVGQVLSAVGLQLDVMRIEFGAKAPEIIPRTSEIQQLLEQVVVQLRELSYELNPSIVDRAGLHFALDRLVGRFRKSYAGNLRLLFDSSVHLPLDIANAFYKLTEFALENAIEHSGATQIEVLIRPTQKAILLEIRDNGKGFDASEPSEEPAGFGLLLMDHYAAQAGVTLSVKSLPQKGTIVRVSFPTEKRGGDPKGHGNV